MASIANTAFEPKVTNLQRNNTQNIAGTFGTVADGTFTGAICPSGFLCTQYNLIANEGYASFGILNTNTWEMVAAADGESAIGDHTGIYAFNSYDVPKATNANGNVWNVGANTLGLELPAGELGTFTEIIAGEFYKFGVGNFSTAPTSGAIYATIVNGLLVASSTAPSAGDGLCFHILAEEGFTLGARYGFDGYILKAVRY